MDLNINESDIGFRDEVRAFLASCWPKADKQRNRSQKDIALFRQRAIEAGYLYRSIPRRYGGSEQAYNIIRAEIIREEFGRVRAPMEVSGNGTSMLVPTLLDCGTEWQREQFIRPTISGEYVWAQGYSEPGAGSDLAALKTSAVLTGDQWVINGHKIWTTDVLKAQFMFALVRTEPDAPKHKGISYLLIDLRQPGVTVRPLKQLHGGEEFGEVFLENVKTPADWIVGNRGEGWSVSKTTLKHERSSIGNAKSYMAMYARLYELAAGTTRSGLPAIQDPVIRVELARIEALVLSQQYSSYRQFSRAAVGKDPGLSPLLNKLVCTGIGHRIAALAQELIAESGLLLPSAQVRGAEKWVNQIVGSLGVAIAGGSSNIQRNIIAERGLDLPRAQGEGA